MRSSVIAVRAIVYAAAFVLFFGWLAVRMTAYDSDLGFIIPEWTTGPGAFLMIAGAGLAAACVGTFVLAGKGTPAVFDPPKEFVARGPYAYVRNPMYIGGFFLLVGFGLYQRSSSILVFAIVLSLLFHLFVLLIEEPGLEKRFGESYVDYKKSVNRWIPKFGEKK